MNGTPSCSPTSWMVTRFGWVRAAAALASWRKRRSVSGVASSPSTSVFSATSGPPSSRCARYTTPMPPRPISSSSRQSPITGETSGNSSSSASAPPSTHCGHICDGRPAGSGRAHSAQMPGARCSLAGDSSFFILHSSFGKGRHEVSDFLLHFLLRGNRLRHFRADQFLQPLPHPSGRHLDRVVGHAQPLR